LGNEGVTAILAGLGAMKCPDLLRLELAHISTTAHGGNALSRLISKGALQRLQWLDIGCYCADAAITQRVVAKLHHLRSLRKLDLMDTTIDIWQALWAAIRSGSLPNLEVLLLADCATLGDGGVVRMAKAIEAGACGELKELSLCSVNMGEVGVLALARAISSGGLRKMEKIDVWGNSDIGDRGMAVLIDALGGRYRTCVNLNMLSLRGTGMADKAGKALLDGLQNNAWPQLQSLSMDNESSSDDWLCDLAHVLRCGGGRKLKNLSLLLYCSAPGGFHQLAISVRQGACPQLRSLWLGTLLSKAYAKACSNELKDAAVGRMVEIRLGRRQGRGYSYI